MFDLGAITYSVKKFLGIKTETNYHYPTIEERLKTQSELNDLQKKNYEKIDLKNRAKVVKKTNENN